MILTFSRLCNVHFLKNMLSARLELVNLDKRDSSGLYTGLFTLRFGLQARLQTRAISLAILDYLIKLIQG